MSVPVWVWIATVGGLLLLILADLVIVDRKPHSGDRRRGGQVGDLRFCAVLFGVGVWILGGHDPGVEFFTGYITEYCCPSTTCSSFMVIMASFRAGDPPTSRAVDRHSAGPGDARGVHRRRGVLIAKFVWIFFLFGAFLVWTAVNMVRSKDEDEEYQENAVTRWVRRFFLHAGTTSATR